MIDTLTYFHWPDIIDVLFLTIVAYYLFIWFKGTKALRALIGLVGLGALYSIARVWGLFLTTWAFQILWQVLVILILILFQNEIRQVLERVSPLKMFARRMTPEKRATLNMVASTAKQIAQRGWGALMVLPRRDSLTGLAGEGLLVEARLSPELLVAVFNPTSPTHDGAVIIEEDRMVRMGAVLPLSNRDDLPSELGTRHRAALGISEVCDAVTVVVSEERGQISLAAEGELKLLSSPDNLESDLYDLMNPSLGSDEKWPTRTRKAIMAHWPIKVGAFFLVFLTWLFLAGQQNYEVNLKTPIEYSGLSSELEVAELSDKEVLLQVSGPRRQASSLTTGDVQIIVNLWGMSAGEHQIPLVRQNIRVPLDLEVTGVSPKILNLILKKNMEKEKTEK